MQCDHFTDKTGAYHMSFKLSHKLQNYAAAQQTSDLNQQTLNTEKSDKPLKAAF